MSTQPFFHTEKLEKNLFLVFEIESNIRIYSLKSLSVDQFVKNFHIGVKTSV